MIQRLTIITNKQTKIFQDFKVALPPKAPATAGAFYFFIHTHKPASQPPIPGTIALGLAQWQVTHGILCHITRPQDTPKPSSITFSLLLPLFPQPIHQSLRSLSPSRMPLALRNLTAIWRHSSGIWLSRISNANGSCGCPGDTRFLLLL